MSWELTGNAGIDPTTNFLGTIDNNPPIIKTNGTDQLRVYSGGKGGPNVEITGSAAIDNALAIGNIVEFASTPNLTVAGPDATVNVETAEILRVMRHGVGGVKNQNSAGLFVGAFEPGINGRSRLDINVAGAPGNSNTWGSVPDVTVMSLLSNGSVGIGTVSPGSNLHIAVPASGNTINAFTLDVESFVTPANANASYFVQVRDIEAAPPNGFTHFCIQGNGNVGIGTASPTAKLEVDGDVKVTGDVILTGADCAEEFDMAEAAEIEPGTVVVLDQDGVLHQSHQAYDKRVAGVISGAGDYRPGMILDRRQSRDNRVPVALVGKVYCKVDAQYAAIEVGDLLTTSPTSGHAMKADDPFKAFGSVIGKALRSLKAGQEMIPILITLQ